MLTSGNESREFLYADDCSKGLFQIMNNFNFFRKKNIELHLTTAKRIKIIEIAKIIQKLLAKRKIKVQIKPSVKKDELQNNINNQSNKFFLKYWKPQFKIDQGIERIIDFYQKK